MTVAMLIDIMEQDTTPLFQRVVFSGYYPTVTIQRLLSNGCYPTVAI